MGNFFSNFYTILNNKIWCEAFKAVVGFRMIHYCGDWFGIGQTYTLAIAIYLIMSVAGTYYFGRFEEPTLAVAMKKIHVKYRNIARNIP